MEAARSGWWGWRVSVTIIDGDCRDVLPTLPAESVHCVVTSPPYFGLRDYGVDGQIGLEPTPDAYVAEMVAVFREVRRVLRGDGTAWLNLGDSYAGSWGAQGHRETPATMSRNQIANHPKRASLTGTIRQAGLKPKDLIGIPWMVAFALRADGWYLRQDIIWHKPNPMPESVADRCTKAHEYLFLLSKSPRYYFDAEAIKEPAQEHLGRAGTFDRGGNAVADHVIPGQSAAQHRARPARSGNKERKPASALGVPVDTGGKTSGAVAGSVPREGFTRNKRSVWTVGTMPLKEAHFATFPPALIEPCILAGCPRGGTVLDPFGGAGTTGLVADRLQRSAILIELSPTYAEMARARVRGDAPLLACGP